MGSNYERVPERHQSLTPVIVRADKVAGDIHWIKEVVDRNKGGSGGTKIIGCGLNEPAKGMMRSKLKSTYNHRHVTCLGCLEEISRLNNEEATDTRE